MDEEQTSASSDDSAKSSEPPGTKQSETEATGETNETKKADEAKGSKEEALDVLTKQVAVLRSGEETDTSDSDESPDGDGEKAEGKADDEIPAEHFEKMRKAAEAGLTADDVAYFEEKGRLDEFLAAQDTEKAPDETSGTDSKDGQKKDETKADTESETETDEKASEMPELDPEDYDPGLLDAMGYLGKRVDALDAKLAKLDELEAKLAGLGQSEQSRERETVAREFDRLRSEAAPAVKTLLGGKESFMELTADGPSDKRCRAVLAQMDAINTGRVRRGHIPMGAEELFGQAVASLFPDTAKQQAKDEIKDSLKKRRSQVSPRPSNRKGADTRTPKDKAVDILSEKIDRMRD